MSVFLQTGTFRQKRISCFIAVSFIWAKNRTTYNTTDRAQTWITGTLVAAIIVRFSYANTDTITRIKYHNKFWYNWWIRKFSKMAQNLESVNQEIWCFITERVIKFVSRSEIFRNVKVKISKLTTKKHYSMKLILCFSRF